MRLLSLPAPLTLLLSLTPFSSSRPNGVPPKPLPLLIWHGLGDRYDAEGLHSVGDLAKQIHPGTHVHYIRLDEDGNSDRSATFFGNLTEQIEDVCEQVLSAPQLWDMRGEEEEGEDNYRGEGVEIGVQGGARNRTRGERRRRKKRKSVRVDALGFSQGGQFLRGLVERCEGLHVRSLVTFGSQHNGIAAFQTCGAWDFLCKGATALLQGNAFTKYVQGKVVPAQYYRTVNESTGEASEEYLENSNFLADVNNEGEEKDKGYRRRLGQLEKFVMFVFEEDETVMPKESGWFAEVNSTSGEVTPLRERAIYKEDWIGLKGLDEKGALVFESTPGRHMALDEEVLIKTFTEYFGPETENKPGVVRAVAPRPSSQRQEELEWIEEQQLERLWGGLWFWQKWGWRWESVRWQGWYDRKQSL